LLRRLLAQAFQSGDKPPEPGNPLADYFFHNPGRLIHKWHHYFEIYHRHFAAFRGRSPVVLEIGVFHGGSLQMWREYFGPGARIVGVDIDPRCRAFEEAPSITVVTGDQADRAFLARLRERFPRIDVLIDDGGHVMAQQIATFEELYPHLHPEGVYLCEDMHTSFVDAYGGGYQHKDSFVEYSKALVDSLYGWYTKHCPQLVPGPLTRSTFALHFYDSVLVLEKRRMQAPQASMTGKPAF
jgi:SAM-dependent methyltransferase